MTKLIRYALATFCFAASAGCLALWWRSMTHFDLLIGPSPILPSRYMALQSAVGTIEASLTPADMTSGFRASMSPYWQHHESPNLDAVRRHRVRNNIRSAFGVRQDSLPFPIWYPALIFALAGVGILRFRRQFYIRSALICLSVVALLLGIALTL